MDELEARKQDLLEKYRKGACSPEELNLLYYFYNHSAHPFSQEHIDDPDTIQTDIWKNLPFYKEQKRKLRIKTSLFAAAAAVVITIGLAYLFLPQYNQRKEPTLAKQNIILPGSQSATLTLANGKSIRLNAVNNGTLANEAGVRITKKSEGALVYEILDSKESSKQYNTLSTTYGETYQLVLPDGTQVWLNAGSSIRYPSSFNALNTRRVELVGEAYFEVAKDRHRPFVVKSYNQEVEVLGTHFNINAYPEETGIKTTLLEGSVKVISQTNSLVIIPGQQTLLSKQHRLRVSAVDAQLAIGWKNNEFVFEQQTIDEVMNTIARWYNVSVVYDGLKPEATFGGGISRFESVSKVLALLEKTGVVRFVIKGRTIHVMK